MFEKYFSLMSVHLRILKWRVALSLKWQLSVSVLVPLLSSMEPHHFCTWRCRLLKLLRVLHVLRSLIYIYFVRIAFIEMCIFFIFSFFREAYLDFCLVCYLSSEDLASGFISYSGISIFLTYFKRFFSYVYTSCLYIFLLFYIFAV